MDGQWRGTLYPARLPSFVRVPPPARVAELVRWFWIPEWDIDLGRVVRQELLPFLACNLVVEPDGVGLSGPSSRRSFRDLQGRGWAVGALLRPAAVAWFTSRPADLVDSRVDVRDPDLHAAVAAAMGSAEPNGTHRQRAVAQFADWLASRLPEPGEEARLANAMTELIDTDPTVIRVGQVASRLGVSTRTVQRLAARYVGVPPLALIRRRRLQEAAERLRSDPSLSVARVAAELGYADQAHLAADFRLVLGFAPGAYRRSATQGPPPASG